MFATKPGYVLRESFSEPFRFNQVARAQPCCIFYGGDDTAPPHSGALSQLVRWMLFSRPCFGEPAGLTATQAARESLLKEEKPMIARSPLSAMGAVRTKNTTLLGAFTIATYLVIDCRSGNGQGAVSLG